MLLLTFTFVNHGFDFEFVLILGPVLAKTRGTTSRHDLGDFTGRQVRQSEGRFSPASSLCSGGTLPAAWIMGTEPK